MSLPTRDPYRVPEVAAEADRLARLYPHTVTNEQWRKMTDAEKLEWVENFPDENVTPGSWDDSYLGWV